MIVMLMIIKKIGVLRDTARALQPLTNLPAGHQMSWQSLAQNGQNCQFRAKGAGAFHSAGQSKEGSVGFGTSQHPIFMKLLPDHLWH